MPLKDYGALDVQHCESSYMKVCTIFCTRWLSSKLFPSPQLLVYATQLANLHVAQSTLTFTTPSTSHKSNSGMHCYIDGEACESITGTKFGTSYYDVSNAYIPNTS